MPATGQGRTDATAHSVLAAFECEGRQGYKEEVNADCDHVLEISILRVHVRMYDSCMMFKT